MTNIESLLQENRQDCYRMRDYLFGVALLSTKLWCEIIEKYRKNEIGIDKVCEEILEEVDGQVDELKLLIGEERKNILENYSDKADKLFLRLLNWAKNKNIQTEKYEQRFNELSSQLY